MTVNCHTCSVFSQVRSELIDEALAQMWNPSRDWRLQYVLVLRKVNVSFMRYSLNRKKKRMNSGKREEGRKKRDETERRRKRRRTTRFTILASENRALLRLTDGRYVRDASSMGSRKSAVRHPRSKKNQRKRRKLRSAEVRMYESVGCTEALQSVYTHPSASR